MSEWNSHTFGELINADVLVIGDGYRAKNDELGGNGAIFLRAGHVRDTHIDFSGTDRFLERLESIVAHKMSQPGDVMVTTKGNSTGRVAYVSPDMPPFVYSPHLSYWRSIDQSRILPGYLRYWSRGREFHEQLAGLSASTDMAPYLSLRDQKRLRITLPPIQMQARIASILGALDDKIDLNRRMNQTLKEMAQAIFKSWFIDFDGQTEFVDSELGPVPAGWEVRPLDEIADFQNGAACQKFPPIGDDTVPVIKIRELRQGFSTASDRVGSDFPNHLKVRDGDVLFSWSGSLVVKLWTGGQGFLNQHVFKVTSESYPRWYYYLWLRHHLGTFQRVAAGKATTMGHIQRHHLSEALTLLPPTDVLAEIGTALQPQVERQVLNDLECNTLATLRDTLLPKLISGELRVPEVEAAAEAAL